MYTVLYESDCANYKDMNKKRRNRNLNRFRSNSYAGFLYTRMQHRVVKVFNIAQTVVILLDAPTARKCSNPPKFHFHSMHDIS